MGDGKFSKLLVGEMDAKVILVSYSIGYDPTFYNILLNVSTSSPIVFNNQIINTGSNSAPLFRIPAGPTGDVARPSLGTFLQRNSFDPRLFPPTTLKTTFPPPPPPPRPFSFHPPTIPTTLPQ